MTNERQLFKLNIDNKEYTFRVDEERRKVVGYLKVPGQKIITRTIRCDTEDHWDAIIGIATVKFRLDLSKPNTYVLISTKRGIKFPDCVTDDKGRISAGWNAIKEFVSGKKNTHKKRVDKEE